MKNGNNNPLSRRRFLQCGLGGAAGLALGGRFLPAAFAQGAPKAKAKAVIQIWMWGGPSHIDSFDPKPKAGQDYTGSLNKTVDTNVDGVQLGSSLPMLAKIADKYALLRGMTHGINGHETASYVVQTGRPKGGKLVYPGAGAVVTHFKGMAPGNKSLLPPYITLTKLQGRFSECGFMGSKYKPFATGGNPSKDPFEVEGIVVNGITEERQHDRRELLKKLDTFAQERAGDPLVKRLDECRDRAYSMILGEEGKVFALDREKKEVRDRYGRTTFGQSCLLARRLVEKGVSYVTINFMGWDTHKQHFQSMGRLLPDLDRGLSALLEDLSSRGLLDTTIVWAGGEFGRGPKVQWEPPWNGGRGHYGKAFSTLVAGGGFKGGVVVGKTDETASNVVERPIYPWDLMASMYQLLGIPLDAKLPHPQGLDVRVSPFADDKIPEKETGGLLKEIM